VLCMLPFAISEAISGDYVIPQWLRDMGILSVREIDYGRRMGIARTQVVFAHPIHFGLYCSLPISLYFVGWANQISFFTRMMVSLTVVGTCFLSVSSGPFFASLFQVSLAGFWWLTRNAASSPWKPFLWTLGIVYAALEIQTDRFALYSIAARLAFNKGTAFYRTLIWEYGTAQVERTPWFGVGFNIWGPKPVWMTNSIDNYWLQVAVSNGIPASFSMIAVFLYMMIRIGKGTYVRGSDAYNLRVGWTCLFVSLALSLGTVTIWNEVLTMIMFMVGAGVYMLQAEPPAAGEYAAAGEAETGSRKRAHSRGARPAGESRKRAHGGGGALGYTRFPGGKPRGG